MSLIVMMIKRYKENSYEHSSHLNLIVEVDDDKTPPSSVDVLGALAAIENPENIRYIFGVNIDVVERELLALFKNAVFFSNHRPLLRQVYVTFRPTLLTRQSIVEEIQASNAGNGRCFNPSLEHVKENEEQNEFDCCHDPNIRQTHFTT